MSQFLVVKDLNFDNIMICFDNSSNELEYTTYNYSNQEMISKMEDCFNDFVEITNIYIVIMVVYINLVFI